LGKVQRQISRCIFPWIVLASTNTALSYPISYSYSKRMLTQAIWWISLLLEGLLLWRGAAARLAVRYPVFYGYIAFVMLQSVLRFFVFLRYGYGKYYDGVFWTTEFTGLLFGCWVVFEIYRVALKAYPGTARMARNVLGFLLAMALAKAIAAAWGNSPWIGGITMLQMERALRTFQAVAVVALVVLFLFYSIPFGKNLRGILLGYAIFISGRVLSLTFVGPTDRGFWFYAYSGTYPLVLGIWVAHLWSYQACPQPKSSVGLERQYLAIAAATQRKLKEARGHLSKVVR
jgi:hypothetical protein